MELATDFEILDSEVFLDHITKKGSNPIGNKIIKGKVLLGATNNTFSWSKIKNCIFEDGISFNGCRHLRMYFENCTFNKSFDIISGEFDNLTLLNISGDNLTITGGIFNNGLFISIKSFDAIVLQGGEFKNSFSISTYDKKTNSYGKIDSLFIFPVKDIRIGSIYFVSANIKDIRITGRIIADLSFTSIKFDKLNIVEAENEGNMSFSNLEPYNHKSSILIRASELNDCLFSNTNLNDFFVSISSSYISQIKSNNVTWFNALSNESNNPSVNRENYRQLKLAMRNQGDNIQALEFEKQELNYHYKSLKWNRKDFVNKLILASNWTNNQGQDWLRAFGVFLGVTFIFYTLIKIAIGHTTIDMSYFWYDAGRFFAIMNPTHSTDILTPNLKEVPKAFLLDSFFRIISAYFIFQIVVAFRKFVNR